MKNKLIFLLFLFSSYSCSQANDIIEVEPEVVHIEKANAEECLKIKNYLGNTENIHPKVLYFPDKWMGYKYWMAYTPYPNGALDKENPCIAVSQDGVLWITPNGLNNPIAQVESNGYNSDTHLVYRKDLNILELWWRSYNSKTSMASIVRKISPNGINWSKTEIVFDYSKNDKLSPAIIFENNRYKMWYCFNGNVYYVESIGNTILKWSNPFELKIHWGDLKAWHMDVIYTNRGYEMVICAYSPGGNNNTADLYYVKEDNEGDCTIPQLILAKSKDKNAIDSRSIYRASILYSDSIYKIYYSCISENWIRGTAITSGKSLLDLSGYRKNMTK